MRQKDLSDAIGLEKVMTFDEWIRQECFKAPPEYAVELAKSAWDYQQQAIDALSLEWAKQQARIQALEKAAQRRVDCGHDDECGGRQKDRCGCGHTELENALEMLLP